MEKREAGLLAAEIATLASGIFGIGYRIVEQRTLLAILDTLGYFTVQANILVLIVIGTSLIRRLQTNIGNKPDRARPSSYVSDWLSLAACLYIAITAIVYQTMLGPGLDSTGFDRVVLQVNHLVTPLLYGTWYVFRRPQSRFRYGNSCRLLIYPAVYALLGTVEGYLRDSFRYFFLDLPNLGAGGFVLFIAIILATFLIVGNALIYFSRRSRVSTR